MFQDKTRNDYVDELCQPNSNIDRELVSSIGWLPLVSLAQIFYLYLFNLEFVSIQVCLKDVSFFYFLKIILAIFLSILISERPKFGIGQRYWPKVSVSELIFFAKTETLFFKFFSFFPTSWGKKSFYKGAFTNYVYKI